MGAIFYPSRPLFSIPPIPRFPSFFSVPFLIAAFLFRAGLGCRTLELAKEIAYVIGSEKLKSLRGLLIKPCSRYGNEVIQYLIIFYTDVAFK